MTGLCPLQIPYSSRPSESLPFKMGGAKLIKHYNSAVASLGGGGRTALGDTR